MQTVGNPDRGQPRPHRVQEPERDRGPRRPQFRRSRLAPSSKPKNWLDGPTPGLDRVGTPDADSWTDPKNPSFDLDREVRGVLAGFVESRGGKSATCSSKSNSLARPAAAPRSGCRPIVAKGTSSSKAGAKAGLTTHRADEARWPRHRRCEFCRNDRGEKPVRPGGVDPGVDVPGPPGPRGARFARPGAIGRNLEACRLRNARGRHSAAGGAIGRRRSADRPVPPQPRWRVRVAAAVRGFGWPHRSAGIARRPVRSPRPRTWSRTTADPLRARRSRTSVADSDAAARRPIPSQSRSIRSGAEFTLIDTHDRHAARVSQAAEPANWCCSTS